MDSKITINCHERLIGAEMILIQIVLKEIENESARNDQVSKEYSIINNTLILYSSYMFVEKSCQNNKEEKFIIDSSKIALSCALIISAFFIDEFLVNCLV